MLKNEIMNVLQKKIERAFEIWRDQGLNGIKRSLQFNYRKVREARNYQKWIREVEMLSAEDRRNIHSRIKNFSCRPLISVVLPVYNVGEKWLRQCIESVSNQIYENWELCIADDCSPSPHVKKVLEEYAARDERVKVVFRAENEHISAASNSALELATGEFVVLLDHDDELSEDALFWVVKEINDFPETQMIYSDEDMIDERGKRYAPKFKPEWSLDLLYSLNLITHLSAYRTEVLRKINGFRTGLEGSQDYDLALRVIERIPEKNIRHIPRILYHWRAIRGSVAFSSDEKPYAHERARQALREHFTRTNVKATVGESVYNLHRVRYELPANVPKISLIVVAEKDENVEEAIENFVGQTDYPNYEIVVVKTSNERGQADLPNVKLVVCESESEAARFNYAASQTDGEILCFADLNLKPLAKDWLEELARFAAREEIGAVGAKILHGDETVLHAGLVVGAGGLVGNAYENYPRDFGGMLGRAQLSNNYSAVSISCLATRRAAFESIGGFDTENLPNRLFDADFCLRLRREKNYRVVFTPYAELIKVDGKRRLNLEKNPTVKEKDYFIKKWKKIVERDPFYNPNLSKSRADFSIKSSEFRL